MLTVRRFLLFLCSVQSCIFVQCWPGIFLMQYRGNLCNVGTALAVTGYYKKKKKKNQCKMKIAEKWPDNIEQDFLLSNIVWICLG